MTAPADADTPAYDALVVGAGAAGLAAARALVAGGQRTLVVDARPRVGGRVHTLHDPAAPVPVELGPEFVHGEPHETWAIVRAARLAVVDVDGQSRRHGPHGLATHDEGPLSDLLERLDPDRAADRSITAFLDEHLPDPADPLRHDALRYVAGFHAADPAAAGERALARAERASGAAGGEHQHRVLGGYRGVIDWLAAGLTAGRANLRLGTVVYTLRWSEAGVEARLRSALGAALPRVRAARAVVTLPLGVLQAPAGAPGAVAFDPPLPAAKQEALALLRAGAVARLTLRFRERFWVRGPDDPLTQLGFAYAPSPWFPVFWTSYPVVSPLLVAWSGGPAAAELARLTEADRLGHALDALARLFDRSRVELEALLEGWHEHDWLADPYSRGAYSYAAVGGADAPAALGAPVGGRLFFAGEATVADGDIGTVHGALRSGSRAAAELLAAARSEPGPR